MAGLRVPSLRAIGRSLSRAASRAAASPVAVLALAVAVTIAAVFVLVMVRRRQREGWGMPRLVSRVVSGAKRVGAKAKNAFKRPGRKPAAKAPKAPPVKVPGTPQQVAGTVVLPRERPTMDATKATITQLEDDLKRNMGTWSVQKQAEQRVLIQEWRGFRAKVKVSDYKAPGQKFTQAEANARRVAVDNWYLQMREKLMDPAKMGAAVQKELAAAKAQPAAAAPRPAAASKDRTQLGALDASESFWKTGAILDPGPGRAQFNTGVKMPPSPFASRPVVSRQMEAGWTREALADLARLAGKPRPKK